MTTNQTIDGVPRELLIEAERIATGYGFPHIGQELRALLDAADHVHEWDINAEGTATVCHCGARSSDEPCEQLATTPTRTALIRGREKLIDERDYWKALAQKSAAQPQGEPVARIDGMYGDPEAFAEREIRALCDVNKLKIGTLLYAEQPAPVAVVPDGYCIMPRQLTAENGAKALMLGEFKLLVTKECPECCELEEPTEGCSICDGEGEYGQKQTIPWDQIKFIYSKAVSGLAVKDETTKSR